MENRKNYDGNLDKKELFTADTTIGYGTPVDMLYEKASQAYACGKTALCAEILRIFKPLVFDEKNCRESYISFNVAANKALGVAGAAAGVAIGIANRDTFVANVSENQFLETLMKMPFVSEALMGYAGNLLARRVHAKSVATMNENGLPTLADAVFGDKGVIPSLVGKAENYLKDHDPDCYEQVMGEVEKSAKYLSDKFDYEVKKMKLEERREKAYDRYMHMDEHGHMMTTEAIKTSIKGFDEEEKQLDETRPERPGIVKRMVLRRKSNPHE